MGQHPLYFVFLKKLLTVNCFTTAIFEYGLQRYNATNTLTNNQERIRSNYFQIPEKPQNGTLEWAGVGF